MNTNCILHQLQTPTAWSFSISFSLFLLPFFLFLLENSLDLIMIAEIKG